MNDVAQDALSRALKSLVADSPVVPGLAERIQRDHRRRRASRRAAGALVLAGAGLAVFAAIWGGVQPSTRTVTFGPAQSARSAITHDLSFDDGALKVTPAAGAPAVAEAEAVSLFRSTGLPAELVQDVSIGYGEVTLKPGLASGWQERAAWVVVYRGGPHGCPARSGLATKEKEGRRVFILDSVSGTDALNYQEGGPWCGFPRGPSAQVAQQYLSLPWTQVSRTNQTLTVRYWYCTGEPDLLTALGTAEQSQVEVVFGRPMKAGQCYPGAGAEHITQVELQPGTTAEPEHAPTGPVTGIYTSLQPNRFVAQPIQN